MITTAGNGPDPSGFDSSTGICSEMPLGVVVAIDGPEITPAHPPAATPSPSAITAVTRRSATDSDCIPIQGPRRAGAREMDQLRDLKYWTARSCASASRRVRNVPRLRRFPVFGLRFRE
jgi:hypothetical protein